jgi:DivIVA domain-containing protein
LGEILNIDRESAAHRGKCIQCTQGNADETGVAAEGLPHKQEPKMPFSPDEIEIKEFVPTLRGYGREEVRAYLRSVSEDVRRLEEQLAAAKSVAQTEKPSQATTVAAVEAPLVDPWSLPESIPSLTGPISAALRVPSVGLIPTGKPDRGPNAVQLPAPVASASVPTSSTATSVLTTTDAGLVVGLKDALTELTQAIARLSTQGLLGNHSSGVPELSSHPAGSSAEFNVNGEKTSSNKLTSIAPNFATTAKPELPFVRVEPQRIVNSGLPKTAEDSWDGTDRRGPARPWKSTSASQMTPTTQTQTEMTEGANLFSSLMGAPENSAATGIAEGSPTTSRADQNQSLIRTFLSGALGLNRKTVDSSPSDSLGAASILESSLITSLASSPASSLASSLTSNPGECTAMDTQAEVDNVVAFKRAAS